MHIASVPLEEARWLLPRTGLCFTNSMTALTNAKISAIAAIDASHFPDLSKLSKSLLKGNVNSLNNTQNPLYNFVKGTKSMAKFCFSTF